jgi:ABC-type dipeptide/oligopeptide/nickel transport system permease subunit
MMIVLKKRNFVEIVKTIGIGSIWMIRTEL